MTLDCRPPMPLPESLPRTHAVLADGRTAGLHHGAQVFVSHRGEVVCDAACGEVRPGEPLTADHFMLWLSSGKPLTAAAVLRCCSHPPGQPEVALDDRVADLFEGGWDGPVGGVTVRQLLTHTGGFPGAETGYPDADWPETILRLKAARLEEDWEVGRTAGYHPQSSWFVLGEIVREATGRPIDTVVREDVLEVARARDARLRFDPAELDAARPRLAPMFRRKSRELIDAGLHTDRHLTRTSPGSSLRGPARDLGRFYLSLLASLKDGWGPILPGLAVEAMAARHRVGEYDRTLGHVVDFGLGVIVDSNRHGPDTVPYGFGPHCSPRTFGHGGSQSSIAFCDPEHELVVAWATNGMCGEPRHQTRNRAVNAAIYEDLGLTR